MTRKWSNQNPNSALKTKREITKITNSQNTKRTYGQPSEQLFPQRWPLSNSNQTKMIWTNTRWNVTETLTPKIGNREPQQNNTLERSVSNYWGGA